MEEPTQRILLVEDDEVDRMAVRRALRSAGLAASLTEVEDAPSAQRALREQAFDCALLDLRLPGHDGLDLLREVRAEGIQTPIIMLTGQGDEQTAVTLMKAGAADYIPKSALTPERLGQSIMHALRVHSAERETQRYAAQLRGLTEAAVAAGAHTSVDAALRSLMERARSILGTHIAVARTVPDEGAAASVGSVSVSEKYTEACPSQAPPSAAFMEALSCITKPVRMTEAELDAKPVCRAFATEAGLFLPTRGWLAAPLIARDGRVLGLIHLSDKIEGEFDERDEAILVQLTQMASAAVENTRLFERVERAADSMARLQAVTAGFSEARTPAEVIDVVMTQGCSALGAKTGLIGLLTENESILEVVRMVGYPSDLVAMWKRIPVSMPIPLVATAKTGEAFFFETPDALAERFPMAGEARHPEDHALVSVPLLVEGRRIGVFGLSFGAPRAFTEEARGFISAIARLCAQALERARLYEAESHARAEAETANRAKDEFLSTLSHELRTPLSAILGWSHMLKLKKSEPGFIDRALATIERNARAQAQLIEDILDVSRIVAGKLRLELRPMDLDAVVRAAVDGARPAAEAKGITVIAQPSPATGLLQGDPQRLQQVAWNLLSNAIKFTPKGGRVEVRLTNRDGHAELCVTDSGQGIAPEFLPHVFERFKQADASSTRSHGGLGLGLAIAKHIVELHGGTIVAESSGLGCGARFVVTLPLTPKENESSEGAGRPTPDFPVLEGDRTSLSGVRVLVVDDDTDGRELLAAVLRERGAEVRLASSAAEALAVIASETIDVLVSDIGMPGEDGYTLMERARAMLAEHERALPALALTAYAGAQDARRAYRVGFQMHLAKPFSAEQVVEAVARLSQRTSSTG